MPKLKFQFTINWQREEEENYIKYVKARIKEAREDKEMTQSDLAKKLKRTQAYFSHLESGGLVPSVVELLGIAQFTEKPIQFFLPIQDTRDDILTGKAWQLVAHFDDIENEEDKDTALSIVRQLARKKKSKATK